jgi:carbon starvation protein
METLLIAVGAFVGYLIAYHTYGRWLSRKIFALDPDANVPSHELRDDVDFVPTKRQIIFGHHFTSIAGTGPIVGPAIAVFWGWLPALLWVFLGSIFIGAVHDFGALVVSLRNRGQTVGEIAGRLISPRARVLFLAILFMALTVVLAIFGLVIATIFKLYPESVLPTWISLPIAVVIGFKVHKKGGGILGPSLIALAIVYFSVWLGAYVCPINITDIFGVPETGEYFNVITVWTMVLLVYCMVASVLPVWVMLQPRDYVNSHQLVVALGLLMIGVIVAGATGQAQLAKSAPAIATNIPSDAPPIYPFLFITIACGACSGFHCLVSSGTTSKQIEKETDAQFVAYGSMLLEGGLAVMVILACCAGVGMGKFDRDSKSEAAAEAAGGYLYVAKLDAAGQQLKGREAWATRYDASGSWAKFRLPQTVGAFVEGGANFLSAIGLPIKLGISIIAVLVACFAATTLDSATRLQRYVVQELAHTVRIKPLTNKYIATLFAVIIGGWVALLPSSPGGSGGTGGLILWPLFGATNQLLAGLAFMVTTFYLWRRGRPVWFAAIPMVIMMILPAWAMLWHMFNANSGWSNPANGKTHLFYVGIGILAIQVWMIVEALLILPRAKGVLEEALPPLQPALAGGESSRGVEC